MPARTPAAHSTRRVGSTSPLDSSTWSAVMRSTAVPRRTSTPRRTSVRAGVALRPLRERGQQAVGPLDQHDPGPVHVEVVEVLLEHLVDQLDQGAGDLDAGRPAADHDEVEDAVVDQRGLAVGRLEQRQEVVPHPDGVLEAVEREGVLLGAVDAEVVGRRTSGDDQVVEGDRALGARA